MKNDGEAGKPIETLHLLESPVLSGSVNLQLRTLTGRVPAPDLLWVLDRLGTNDFRADWSVSWMILPPPDPGVPV
jgi:hypothetical protein